MTLPTSLLAYQDCTEILDRALADDLGARIKASDHNAAMYQKTRLHYCRKLHREENLRVYDLDNPLHGRSAYDALTVRIRKVNGDFYIYIERNDIVRGEIEPLSAVSKDEKPETVPQTEIEVVIPPKIVVTRRV